MRYSDLEFLGYFHDVEVKLTLTGDNHISINNRCIHRTKQEELCGDCSKLIEKRRNDYDELIDNLKKMPDKIFIYRLSDLRNC